MKLAIQNKGGVTFANNKSQKTNYILNVVENGTIILKNLFHIVSTFQTPVAMAIKYLYENPVFVKDKSGKSASIFEYVVITIVRNNEKFVVKPTAWIMNKNGDRVLESLFSQSITVAQWLAMNPSCAIPIEKYGNALLECMGKALPPP